MGRSEIIKKLITNGCKAIQVWEKECNCYLLITDVHSTNGQKYSLHRKFSCTALQMSQYDLIAYEEEISLNALYNKVLKAAE